MSNRLKIYRQHPEAFTIDLDTDEHCILQPVTGKYYQINATGLMIWSLLKQSNSLEEIHKIINEKNPKISERLIVLFVSTLCKNYLAIEEEISVKDFDLYRILIGLG